MPDIEIEHILPAPKAWTWVGRMRRMRLKMSRALKPAVPAMVRVVSDVRSRMQYVYASVYAELRGE